MYSGKPEAFVLLSDGNYAARHSWVEILRNLNTVDKTNLTLGHFILFLFLLTFQKIW